MSAGVVGELSVQQTCDFCCPCADGVDMQMVLTCNAHDRSDEITTPRYL